MVILGIDPGIERCGFGVVERKGSQIVAIEHGLIETPRIELGARLSQIEAGLSEIVERRQPDCIAYEKLFFSKNQTTAVDVASCLGVVLLLAHRSGVPVAEYSPPTIKLAITGNGRAEKNQVQFMIAKLLGLKESPKPDDVADALAIAVTHAFQSRTSPKKRAGLG